MTGYKIVSEYRGALVSSCIRGPLAFTYIPGKWTKRRKYGPMIFPTIEDCIHFMRKTFDPDEFGLYHIWKCEYNEEVELDMFFYSVEISDITYRTYLRWVDCMNNGKTISKTEDNSYYFTSREPGAIVTTQIKLIEEMEVNVGEGW